MPPEVEALLAQFPVECRLCLTFPNQYQGPMDTQIITDAMEAMHNETPPTLTAWPMGTAKGLNNINKRTTPLFTTVVHPVDMPVLDLINLLKRALTKLPWPDRALIVTLDRPPNQYRA